MSRPVTITTFCCAIIYIAPEIIAISDIIVILKPFYVTEYSIIILS